MAISGLTKALKDIMRMDEGINGDAQYIGQIAWLLFLKAFGALFRLTLQDVFDTQIGFGNEAGMYGRDRHQFHFPIQAWNTV